MSDLSRARDPCCHKEQKLSIIDRRRPNSKKRHHYLRMEGEGLEEERLQRKDEPQLLPAY